MVVERLAHICVEFFVLFFFCSVVYSCLSWVNWHYAYERRPRHAGPSDTPNCTEHGDCPTVSYLVGDSECVRSGRVDLCTAFGVGVSLRRWPNACNLCASSSFVFAGVVRITTNIWIIYVTFGHAPYWNGFLPFRFPSLARFGNLTWS